jgi:hypothetical protein
MKEQMREAFEAWAKDYSGDFDFTTTPSGTYIDHITYGAWIGYRAGLAALSAVPESHIGDSTKLAQAVSALAAQTGESAESITEWLTDKGGLTMLMLSHFGGNQSQAQQPAQEPIAWKAITLGYRKFVTQSQYEKFSLSAQCWYVPFSCDSCKAQEPVKQESWISVEERLPDHRNDVLCFVVSNEGETSIKSSHLNPAKTGFYVEYEFDEPIEKVTHWMPLPLPPVEAQP